MRTSEFFYRLPEELIAQRPLERRDASRMLLVGRSSGRFGDLRFDQLPETLRGDELLVVNDVRVFPVRLIGKRRGLRAERVGQRGKAREYLQSPIEVLLLREREEGFWEALVRPGRKMRIGEQVVFGEEEELEAEVVRRGEYGLRELRFSVCDVRARIEKLGHVPLPPYIDRVDDRNDRERYQTVFAARGTAAACPTAGLHFTPEILGRIRERGAEICTLTLEVGLGTFQPIHSENVEDHKIHSESYEIPEETAERIRQAKVEGRPVLAVGTTVVRALEHAARKQGADGTRLYLQPGKDSADIFIYPGHEFRIVDQMLTNFHLPESSLLILVCAFAGKDLVLRGYRHAVGERYRFYSYGDCMLMR